VTAFRSSKTVMIHGGAVLSVVGTLLLGMPALTLIFGGCVMAVTYVVLGLAEARRAPLWINPLSFYLLWYACGLGLSAVYIGALIAIGDEISFSVAGIAPMDLATGYVVFLVGSVALHAGLQSRRPVGPESASWRDRGIDHVMLVVHAGLWIFGLSVMWDYSWLVRFGAAARLLQWMALAAIVSFALASGFGVSRIVFRVLLGVATITLFGANMMSFSKAYLMYSFLPIVWLCLVRSRARRWLPVVAAMLIALYLVVIAPVVMQARSVPLQEKENPAQRLVNTFVDFFDEHSSAITKISLWDPVDSLLRRQFDPAVLGYLVGEVRAYGLQYGGTMDYIQYAFVPRILWPNKPTVTRGAWFTTYTGFSESEEEATTSLGISATGELYWNFGVPGVVIGMFAIGWLLAQLWRLATTDPRGAPVRMLLYVVLVVNMPNMSEFVTVLVSIVMMGIVFGALIWISPMFGRPRSPIGVAPA
jgi:hypothetical protein